MIKQFFVSAFFAVPILWVATATTNQSPTNITIQPSEQSASPTGMLSNNASWDKRLQDMALKWGPTVALIKDSTIISAAIYGVCLYCQRLYLRHIFWQQYQSDLDKYSQNHL